MRPWHAPTGSWWLEENLQQGCYTFLLGYWWQEYHWSRVEWPLAVGPVMLQRSSLSLAVFLFLLLFYLCQLCATQSWLSQYSFTYACPIGISYLQGRVRPFGAKIYAAHSSHSGKGDEALRAASLATLSVTKLTQSFNWWTPEIPPPPKINIEPENDGLVQMIFLFQGLYFSGSMLIFRGVWNISFVNFDWSLWLLSCRSWMNLSWSRLAKLSGCTSYR